MSKSLAITSAIVHLIGPIEFEVSKHSGLSCVRIGPFQFRHEELEEWQHTIASIGQALDRMAQGDLPDVHAISGEHPATGGE